MRVPPSRSPYWLGVLVAAAIAAGVALRVWIWTTPELGALDSDEAVPGLMARHFLQGDLSTFYWGQSYGGTAEIVLLALGFLVAGSNVVVLRLVPIVLYGIAAVLLWRIGRRTIGEPGATVAALLFWVWPTYFVWRSTREYGYYGVLLVCGLSLLLLALRLNERPNLRDAAGLGAALGVGWWSSAQIALVAVPVVAWLVFRRPPIIRCLALTAGVAIATASPWIVANVRSGWASLDLHPDKALARTYGYRLEGLFTDGLPNTVGLRALITRQWLPTPALGQVAFWLLLAALLAVLVHRRRSLTVVGAILVPFPFLYAVSGYTWYRDEPRYLGLLAPLLALLAGALFSDPRLAALALIAATTLSVVGLTKLRDLGGFGYGSAPTTVAPVIRTLDRERVTRARADYWVAFRITFLTRERIIVAPTTSSRHRQYDELVAQSARVARIFVVGARDEPSQRQSLLGAGYRAIPAGQYNVYVPAS